MSLRNLSFFLVLALSAGCSETENFEVRDRANAECAEIVVEMRADLNGLYERVDALAATDERLLRIVQYTTHTDPFRNPSPCFGHPSLALDVPSLFSGSLEASLGSLRADFDNAGRLREYDALESGWVRDAIQTKIRRLRVLAGEVARREQ